MSLAALDRTTPSESGLDEQEPTIIGPPGRWPGLGLQDLWRDRALCLVLAKRNLRVRYRQTVIGAAWSLLQPVLFMLVFTVYIGWLGHLPSDGLPYPVFFFLGLMPWQMVSKILNEGSTSVVNNASMLQRVYFPRAYFPVSVALASLFDLTLTTGALAILLAVYGIVPGIQVIFAPIFIFVAWTAGLGIAFWLSSLNVFYRDVTQLLPFLTQLGFFASPIFYPGSLVPEPFQNLYFLNPFALVIDGFRWAITNVPPPPLNEWIVSTTSAVVILATGYLFFRSREKFFADVV